MDWGINSHGCVCECGFATIDFVGPANFWNSLIWELSTHNSQKYINKKRKLDVKPLILKW
jgi:hypothetical protein